jgi:predicted RNA-binding protein YlxR (DUF448 family)
LTTSVEQSAPEKTGGRKSERTCAACRRLADSDSLLRLVRTPDGHVVVDWRRKLGGRGAHVCPTRSCITAAIRGRALEKVFHATVEYPDVEELVASARDSLSRRLGALLGSALGARKAAVGSDAVERSLSLGHAACLLVASDASERVEIERRAAERKVPLRVVFDKMLLGEMLGKRPTAVMALGDRGLAIAVFETLERLETLQ